MASVVISGNTSGSITLAAPAVSGSTTLTLPAVSGTIITTTSGSAVSAGYVTNLALNDIGTTILGAVFGTTLYSGGETVAASIIGLVSAYSSSNVLGTVVTSIGANALAAGTSLSGTWRVMGASDLTTSRSRIMCFTRIS